MDARTDPLPDPASLSSPVVVMGGAMGVADLPAFPWLRRECEWISLLLAQNHRLLGICLGAQLMAHALGACVQACSRGTVECGYTPTRASGLPDWVYHWHQDGIRLGSVDDPLLQCLGASTWQDGETSQGFVRGRALGVQFHPEVDAPMIDAWQASDPAFLGRPGARPAVSHHQDHHYHGAAVRAWLEAQLQRLWFS
jgi:GMP synthase (glutamine-hydrolysing)